MFHPVPALSPLPPPTENRPGKSKVALCGRQQVALPNKVRSSDTLVDHTPSVNTHKNITPNLCLLTLMLTLTPIDMYFAIHRSLALFSVENCPGLQRRFKPAIPFLSSLLLFLASPGFASAVCARVGGRVGWVHMYICLHACLCVCQWKEESWVKRELKERGNICPGLRPPTRAAGL